MGCYHRTRWQLICIIVSLSMALLHQTIVGSESYDPESLDILAHDYAMKTLDVKGHTGTLHTVSLPANCSGMHVSVLRLRSFSLWEKGVNISSFYFPPRVVTFPFVKRLALVYENLGNWSSYYYKVPNHHLVAPVVGLMAYDATNISASRQILQFTVQGDPILVHFPQISDVKDKNATLKCVRFSVNGLIHFMNMTKGNACVTTGDGHFSVVVEDNDGNKIKNWVWWVVGFGAGVGLFFLGIIGFNSLKIWRTNRIKGMENESQNGVPFETTRVGMSRMPSASGVRTQPNLEHGYAP